MTALVLKAVNLSVGERLYRARIKSRLKQVRAAELAGISHATISNIELGRVKEPSLSVLKKLCPVYGISLDSLAGISDRSGPQTGSEIELIKLFRVLSFQDKQRILSITKDWVGVIYA